MEIQKLLLFVSDKDSIEIEDIDAIIGEASALNLETISFSAASGKLETALSNLDKALSSGHATAQISSLLNRHFMRLLKARTAVSKGQEIGIVIKRMQPPLHFKLHDAFKSQLNFWTEPKLLKALDLIQQTTLRCRTNSNIENLYIERLLLSISQLAKK